MSDIFCVSNMFCFDIPVEFSPVREKDAGSAAKKNVSMHLFWLSLFDEVCM